MAATTFKAEMTMSMILHNFMQQRYEGKYIQFDKEKWIKVAGVRDCGGQLELSSGDGFSVFLDLDDKLPIAYADIPTIEIPVTIKLRPKEAESLKHAGQIQGHGIAADVARRVQLTLRIQDNDNRI